MFNGSSWITIGEWHAERRWGTPEQAATYCKKEDTRVEGPWEWGKLADGPGQRSDLLAIAELARGGASLKSIAEAQPATFIRYHSGIKSFHALCSPPTPNTRIEGKCIIVIESCTNYGNFVTLSNSLDPFNFHRQDYLGL